MAKTYQVVLNEFGLGNVQTKVFPSQQVQSQSTLHSGSNDAAIISYLDTPVFADVILRPRYSKDAVQLITALCSVSQTKNIVTTAVQGLNGTVKEYISDGDYVISIKGAIVSAVAGIYPSEDVRALYALCKRQEALEVVSGYLQLFGIYELVITDYNFPQSEGIANTQFFELSCLSETPIDLIEDV